MFTYYDVLGVNPKANQIQIRRAYNKRVKLVHPDVVHDDRALQRVKLLNRAYRVLRHTDRRQAYDNALLSTTGHYNCSTEQITSGHDFRWLASVSLWLAAIGAIWFFNSLEINELMPLLGF